MKLELFLRMFHIQQDKLDICLEFNEEIAELTARYVDILPSEYKKEFITIAREFIDKYNKLSGMEGDTNEEEQEE